MDLSTLSVTDLQSLRVSLCKEWSQRQLAFLTETAKQTTLTKKEATAKTKEFRRSYRLPLADWALVQLAIIRDKEKLAKKECAAFYPIIYPVKNERTKEYIELFGEPPDGVG